MKYGLQIKYSTYCHFQTFLEDKNLITLLIKILRTEIERFQKGLVSKNIYMKRKRIISPTGCLINVMLARAFHIKSRIVCSMKTGHTFLSFRIFFKLTVLLKKGDHFYISNGQSLDYMSLVVKWTVRLLQNNFNQCTFT